MAPKPWRVVVKRMGLGWWVWIERPQGDEWCAPVRYARKSDAVKAARGIASAVVVIE